MLGEEGMSNCGVVTSLGGSMGSCWSLKWLMAFSWTPGGIGGNCHAHLAVLSSYLEMLDVLCSGHIAQCLKHWCWLHLTFAALWSVSLSLCHTVWHDSCPWSLAWIMHVVQNSVSLNTCSLFLMLNLKNLPQRSGYLMTWPFFIMRCSCWSCVNCILLL